MVLTMSLYFFIVKHFEELFHTIQKKVNKSPFLWYSLNKEIHSNEPKTEKPHHKLT